MDRPNNGIAISMQTFQRLPYYLQYLKKLHAEGFKVVSAPTVAAYFHYGEIQVRKDFAAVCSTKGKPRQGFEIPILISDIETILGYRNTDEAVLVGVGSLGRALISYGGFAEYGLKIVAAFDSDERLTGAKINGTCVLAADKISDLCRRMNIYIGIITVPADQAQLVCDHLVAGGILAIWNFSPVHLNVPKHILVQNENMAASFALLSRHLREHMTVK